MISFQNNVALGVDQVGQLEPLNIVPPLVEEVLDSVLCDVHQGSLEESLFEILVLTSILKRIERALHSPLQEPIEDLTNAARAMGQGLAFTLPDRLRCVMPMLECPRHIQIHGPLGNLEYLLRKFAIIVKVLSDCL